MEIDKEEVKSRFKRSIESYDAHARIQTMVVERLSGMVAESIREKPGSILEIGCGTGLMTEELKRLFPESELYVNDLVEELCIKARERCGLDPFYTIPGDIEDIPVLRSFDLIASASTFQWFGYPEATFQKLAMYLNPGGSMIFSTYGKYNLREIRLTTGGGLHYRSQEEIMELLDPWFRVEQIREEFKLMEFSSPLAILQHLKKTGVNVSGDKTLWTKGRVNAFIEEYNNRFALDGKVTLTYHPLYLVCRKR